MSQINKVSKVLITGSAGFIGSHLTENLLEHGYEVTGLDNFDDFYQKHIKIQNLRQAIEHPRFRFHEVDIVDASSLRSINLEGTAAIVHLAAKAGVRPSILDPVGYYKCNVIGKQKILDLAKQWKVPSVLFASSSSVYGTNPSVPWKEDDLSLRPISPYAASKLAGEQIGAVYSHLYGIRFIALRFFTVYGPRQRPDLAIAKLSKLISAGLPVPVYGDGTSERDYTFIDDTVAGITAALGYTKTPYEVINLGNSNTISLNTMIETLELHIGKRAFRQYLPMQAGDVPRTWASLDKATALLGYAPGTSFPFGIQKYIDWLANNRPIGKDLKAQ